MRWGEPQPRGDRPKAVKRWVLLWSLLAFSACGSGTPMGGAASTDVAGSATTVDPGESSSVLEASASTTGPTSSSPTPTSTAQATTTVAPSTETSATTIFIDTNGTDPNLDQSEPRSAWWTLDPSFTPTPESMSLPIVVVERACASGIAPTGRIEATVEYLPTEVRITVIVNTVGGDVNCPGNAPEPFTVELTEALGDRQIVGEQPPPF